MVPGTIVEEAVRKGLDIIGICDHNAAENVIAVRKAAERKRTAALAGQGIAVIGGMEITSEEEVHILALFDDDENLLELQRMVYDNLPGVNDEEAFGEQLVVNENDEVIAVNKKLLIGATGLPLRRIVDAIHSLCGLAVASHVDRESFSIIGQLGFIPEGLRLDALEVTHPAFRGGMERARAVLPRGFPLVTFSDAHYPEDIGKRYTDFLLEEASVQEMKKALLAGEGIGVFFFEAFPSQGEE